LDFLFSAMALAMLHEAIFINLLLFLSFALVLQALPQRATWARMFAVLVVQCLTFTYMWWRVQHLPTPTLTLGFAWPAVFFAWELLAIVYECWTHLVLTRISDRSGEADRLQERLLSLDELPTVDVWIATYEEPVDIVRRTIEAAVNLDYPLARLRVYLLDDGQRKKERAAQLREVCEHNGVTYIARPVDPVDAEMRKRVNYAGKDGKAGSHRNAFEKTNGDYILQLDADFCVEPEFLRRCLGFLVFNDLTGVIQVPQRFRNPDPVAYNLLGQKAWCEAQHFFMTVTEPSRDAWGNGFCVGTCCIVPRALIREIGGYPHATNCEDMELSYVLLSHGYRTVVLNEPLAYGLAPESVPEYLKQRVRWCFGTIQHLFIKSGPIRGSYRLLDRIFYIEGSIYWLSFVFLVCLLFAPAIFWLTGVPAISGPSSEVIWVLLPRLMTRSVLIYWLSLGKVPPLVVTVMNALGALHFSRAALTALVWPSSVPFNVTTKGGDRDTVVVRWPLFFFFFGLAATIMGLMLLNLSGVLPVVPRGDMTPLNVIWSLYSTLICLLSALVCIELPKRESDIWVMREVVETRPLETIKALYKRLMIADYLGIGISDVIRRAWADCRKEKESRS
jgi:cellulose synthase (UDP-forming)